VEDGISVLKFTDQFKGKTTIAVGSSVTRGNYGSRVISITLLVKMKSYTQLRSIFWITP
jgi:hypothetical protein